LHYCYGLSVLHSHLAVGASVLVGAGSVVDPCSRERVRRERVTNFAGVPHTFELLDRVGGRGCSSGVPRTSSPRPRRARVALAPPGSYLGPSPWRALLRMRRDGHS
jgi:hypothetical protein